MFSCRSPEPQQGCGKGQHCHEIDGFFLISRGDAAKILELAEQAFDHMALLVVSPIACSWLLSVGFCWNHRLDPSLLKPRQKPIRVVPFVRQTRVSRDPLHRQ